MKKFLKLFIALSLVLTFTFYVKAEEEQESQEQVETLLINEAPVVSIKGNNNTLILSWESIENATKYVISKSTDGKKFKDLKTITGLTYTDKKLTYGKTYYYKVRAVGKDNNMVSTIYKRKVVPNKITKVTLKAKPTEVTISWNKVSASGYYIYRSTNKDSGYKKIATIKKGKTVSYTNKKLKQNTTYYYKVQAYQTVKKKNITGTNSDVFSIKTSPDKPKLKEEENGIYGVLFSFKSVKGATKYEIYHSNSKNGKYELYDVYTPDYFYENETSVFYEVEKAYKDVFFKVRSCNDKTCSPYSTITLKAHFVKPQINSIKGENKKVTIIPSYSYQYQGYEIYRATSKKGKYSKVATIKTPTNYTDIVKIVDSKVKANKTYYYKVRAYGTVDGVKKYSPYSPVRNVKTGKNAAISSATEDAKRVNKMWSGYSKPALIDELVYFGYKKADATKGIDKAKINFKNNAVFYLKEMVEYSVVTAETAESRLKEYGFTTAETNYALSKVKIDWHKSLTNAIKNELNYGVSKQYLIDNYTNDYLGFTEAQVLQVINELDIDFNEQAIIKLEDHLSYSNISKEKAKDYLIEDELFTEDEANYALEHAKVDWNLKLSDAYNRIDSAGTMSKAKIYETLTSEEYGFSTEELDEEFNSDKYNWNERALTRLQNIIDTRYNPVNRIDARNFLTNDKFTTDEIEYAINNTNEDVFVGECIITINEMFGSATDFGTLNGISKANLTSRLKEKEFTNSEIEEAITTKGFNFDTQARLRAEYLIENDIYSESKLLKELKDDYLFTQENVDYVANTVYINYRKECSEFINKNYIGQEVTKTLDEMKSEMKEYGFTDSQIEGAIIDTNLTSLFE